jgi:hypothetical protein
VDVEFEEADVPAEPGRAAIGIEMDTGRDKVARREGDLWRTGSAGTRVRRWRMQAAVGDRFHVRGNIVGQPERAGEIVEVRGAGGEPPYLVRFDDGHTSLVFPGPDAVVEHLHKKGKKGRPKAG